MTKIELLRFAGAFTVGVVAGATVTWVVMRHFKKKKADVEASEELKSTATDVDRSGRDEIIAAARAKMSENAGERKVLSQYLTSASQYSYDKPDLNRIEEYLAERESPSEDDSEEEGGDWDENPYHYDDSFKNSEPFMISEDDFGDGDPLFMRYYIGDKALCESENEEIVASPEDYISNTQLNLMPPGRLVWFRAPKMGCDIEVDIVSGSYHEDVLGMTDKEWSENGGLEGYLSEIE